MKFSSSDLHGTNALFLITLSKFLPCPAFWCVTILHYFFNIQKPKRNHLPPSVKWYTEERWSEKWSKSLLFRKWQHALGLGLYHLCVKFIQGRPIGRWVCALKKKQLEKSQVSSKSRFGNRLGLNQKILPVKMATGNRTHSQRTGWKVSSISLARCLESKTSWGFQDKWARNIWIIFSQKLRCLSQWSGKLLWKYTPEVTLSLQTFQMFFKLFCWFS